MLNWLTGLQRRLLARRQRETLLRRIGTLPVDACGTDDEGDPWLRLTDGTTFFGHPTDPDLARSYERLPLEVRSRIPFECVGLARDVIIRYQGHGLRLNGPTKEHVYQLRAGNTLVEMGAYAGFFAVYAAAKVGPSGRVIAIEPVPANIRLLRKNIASNRLGNVTIVNKGVWHSPGTQTFHLTPGDMQTASIDRADPDANRVEIEVDCLDSILEQAEVNTVDLMIIQLNGAELSALEGMQRHHPAHLAIAARYPINDAPGAPQVCDHLAQRGYHTEMLEEAFVFARAGAPSGTR